MIRENWRILLLIVLLLGSTAALFGPLGATAAEADDPTNLEYGLELNGGTRIRAPLVGYTVTDVSIEPERRQQVQQTIADELNVSLADVNTRLYQSSTDVIEVYSENFTRQQLRDAVTEAGLKGQKASIREGVTDQTRQTAVRVLNEKINKGGLTGGSASVVSSPGGGEKYILVEVPNANRSEVIDLIGSPGKVQIVAGYPVGNGTYNRTALLSQGDFQSIGSATRSERGNYSYVRVTLEDDAAKRFAQAMRQYGFTSDRGTLNCNWRADRQDYGYCLFTVQDGTIVYASSMGDRLAQSIESGEWQKDPTFQMTANNLSQARQLELNLRAGALPTRLDFDEGTTYYIAPSLAQKFKPLSVVTGLIAVLAVSIIVYLRYREVGVAAPMVLTASAEVYLLLGFASLVGLALDLSHIAGFIAVIGTGVDDLVIIADEILQGEEVRTGRVFESRFRKAFWVIGAAAATTIIAMSPLAVLSLGDLQGFAIVTIVGVLLGVLVTRPAYGNILRNIVLD